MKSKIMLLILTLLITACSGVSEYVVKRSSDDQFADKKGPVLITLKENYIEFKNPVVNEPFSQLIPYVLHNRTGNIIDMGFYLINVQGYFSIEHRSCLAIRDGDEIIFLSDGKRISAIARNTSSDQYTQDNSAIKLPPTTTYFDYAWYSLTKEQMETICNATDIKIKVIGHDGTDEYGTGKHPKTMKEGLNKAFYFNNKKFFNEEILGNK